jgi:ArsR family transcriptional regulator
MDSDSALSVFAALAQPTRFQAFRLLIEREPKGMPSGDIARHMAVPYNTMSTHLAILSKAGLIEARRRSQSVIYRARLEALEALVGYLLKECCGGRPEIRAGLASRLLPLLAETGQRDEGRS